MTPAPQSTAARDPWLVPFVNLAHFTDHLVMLIFPTVAVLIARDWALPYSQVLPWALGGFIAFGAFALPAGWLGDHWSRYRMMALFFFGAGASLFACGLAQSPWQVGLALFFVGVFAAIYHPIGTALLVADPKRIGTVLGWNGLWGNFGLAGAALLAGLLSDFAGWRAAFLVPGLLTMAAGVGWLVLVRDPGRVAKTGRTMGLDIDMRVMWRIFGVVVMATVCGGIIFNATTVAMPKVFFERMSELTQTGFGIGVLISIVYCIAAVAQVLVGTLIDRVDIRRVFIPVALLQIPFLFLAGSLEGVAMLVASVLMMLAVFGQIPLNDAILGRYIRDEYRARAFSVRYLISIGVASLAVPLIAWLHGATGGFRSMFTLLSVLAVVTLVAAFLLPSRAELESRRERPGPVTIRESA